MGAIVTRCRKVPCPTMGMVAGVAAKYAAAQRRCCTRLHQAIKLQTRIHQAIKPQTRILNSWFQMMMSHQCRLVLVCALTVDMAPLVSSVERHQLAEGAALIVVTAIATKCKKVPCPTMGTVVGVAAKYVAARRRCARP